MEQLIMAMDQGTTSSRCILFNRNGQVRAMAQQETRQIYPEPGWVEHDPIQIWETQKEVSMQALRQCGATADQILAIGITNQRETVIAWDKKTGRPVCNAIVWQCRRTAPMIEKLKQDGLQDYVRKTTGLEPDAYYSGSKMAWILLHVEGAREKAQKGELLFGTVDSWLIWKLTHGAVHATDYTNASRTMLFDIHKCCWDQRLLDYFEIPRKALPDVRPSSGVLGLTDLFGNSIPIAGVAGDQQAALFGQRCFAKGDVKNTYGTGCFMLMHTGDEPVHSKHRLLTTIAASVGTNMQYALEGSVFVAGAAIQWLRDEMHMLQSASESAACCYQVSDNGGIYLVPAFSGLGAPYWNQYARGTIVGLTRGTNRNHLVRAAVEAMAYQVCDLAQAMQRDGGISLHCLKVDGGASVNPFLLQFQADMLNAEIVRPACIETTALGAAYLAGLACGWWANQNEICQTAMQTDLFSPAMDTALREKNMLGWQRAVASTLFWQKYQG